MLIRMRNTSFSSITRAGCFFEYTRITPTGCSFLFNEQLFLIFQTAVNSLGWLLIANKVKQRLVTSSQKEGNTEAVAKKFCNFHRKTLALGSPLMLQHFRSTTLLKKTPTQVFSCEYCETPKNTYFEKTHANSCF